MKIKTAVRDYYPPTQVTKICLDFFKWTYCHCNNNNNNNNKILIAVIVVQLLRCVWLCGPMDGSTPGSPVLHCLLQFAQIHVHWVSEYSILCHPLLLLLQFFPDSGSFPMSWPFNFGIKYYIIIYIYNVIDQIIFKVDFL